MKKLFLLLLAAVGMIFTACQSGSDIEEDNGGTPSTPKIELSQQSVEVDFESAQHSISITSPCSWEATAKNDWIEVITENGIAGTKELKFSVERNEVMESREGTLVIKNSDYNLVAELYVIQKAFVPTITIEPETLNFTVEGGTQEVVITANFEYEYIADVDWITFKKTGNGINVTVKKSDVVTERTAEITISSEKYGVSEVVKVTQGAFVPEWSVSPESLAFAVEGGTQEIAITANFEYAYSANADWLTIEKSEKGISVTAQNNVEVDERTAEITISNEKYISKVVKVSQGAFVPTITIEPETLNFAGEGGSQKVTITANFEYEVTADADWITISKSETEVEITANASSLFEERTANITISNDKYKVRETVKVSQNAVSESDNNVIAYTSSNSTVVTPNKTDVFGANIVSNTYENGKGVIVFDAPVTSIGYAAFYYRTSLTSITIPNSVTSIGNSAFSNCRNLTSVTIGNSVTSIGGSAFYCCASLTSVTIPDSVTSIGVVAFEYCTSLTSVTIPDSVTSIGEGAFYGCTSLKAFYGKFASSDNRCLIVDGVLNSFAIGCGATEYAIPDSVTSIGQETFRDCTSLTSITIPDSVTSIGVRAFQYCTSLKSITIGNSVTSIGGGAFSGCTSLTSVTIPDSVTSIGGSAFSGCSSLTSVYCKPTTPPIGGSSMFASNASGRKIYVPRNSVEAYKSAQYWSDYADHIEGYDF